MSHLVDQVPKSNIGKSYRESGFPSNTPTFVFTFYKNTYTKGYYRNGNYTVDNINIDLTYENSTLSLDQNCKNYDEMNACVGCKNGMKVMNGVCRCPIGQVFN